MKRMLLCILNLWAILFTAQDTASFNSYAEAIHTTFGNLPRHHYPSGILMEKAGHYYKMPFVEGQQSDSTSNFLEWYLYFEKLYYAQDSNAFIANDYLYIDSIKNVYVEANNILPFGILNFQYEQFKDSVIEKNYLTAQSHSFTENASDSSLIYERKRLFCVAPLNELVNTLNPQFIISQQFVFSNTNDSIIKIEIDLDDGSGFTEVLNNVVFQASYLNGGYKTFITRFILDNGDTLYSNSLLYVSEPEYMSALLSSGSNSFDYKFKVLPDANLYPSEFDFGNDPSNTASIGVWLACNSSFVVNEPAFPFELIFNKNTVSSAFPNPGIRKPVIVFSGYNPTNGKSLKSNNFPPWINDNLGPAFSLAGWRGPFYETYNGYFTDASKGSNTAGSNGSELFEKMRAEGYDIIIVQFNDGIGHLQLRAHLVSEVIKAINILKQTATNPGADIDPLAVGYPNTTSIKKANHENIVIGYSAGALGSRMGLLLMEFQMNKFKTGAAPNIIYHPDFPHHNSRIWVSYDSEHQGSNVPIGLQMSWDFLSKTGLPPANLGDILHGIVAKSAMGIMDHRGLTTDNNLYHHLCLNGNSNVWNIHTHGDYNSYFNDLLDITQAAHPPALEGYPKDCYRIAVAQGNANNGNNTISHPLALSLESPNLNCMNPAGALFGVHISGVQVTSYKKAEAFFIVNTGTQLVLNCKLGLNYHLGALGNWHSKIMHKKFWTSNFLANAKPYDVAAASTLPSHVLFGKGLKLAFEDLNIASYSLCNFLILNRDQHGLSPMVSALDLHNQSQSWPRFPDLTLNPKQMGLFFENSYGNTLNAPSGNSFGFPHLKYPQSHYAYTPFDAVWANDVITTNYNENTMHVEDPNPQIADFLEEEIAGKVLYLSNRQIGSASPFMKYKADFEARYSVLAGDEKIYEHNISNPYKRVRTEAGNFEVLSNAIVSIRANNGDGVSSVVLGQGFRAHEGCVFRAYIHGDTYCPTFNYANTRTSGPITTAIKEKNGSKPLKVKRATSTLHTANDAKKTDGLQIFPNPSDGALYFSVSSENSYRYTIVDLSGRILQEGVITSKENRLDLKTFEKGIYLITLRRGEFSQCDRIILY